jgi:8-oxo-dGTP pyrophosphatase MutT (NUDIX family)
VAAPRSDPRLILAAGGLLWRERDGGRVLAVVHRPKYDDWSLPKGKLDPGESLPDAALREVEEETGCRGRLERFAGTTCYEVKGVPKVVLFWHMAIEREEAFAPSKEVDTLEWLAPDAARERLTHRREIELL